jgi:hypothetical protein
VVFFYDASVVCVRMSMYTIWPVRVCLPPVLAGVTARSENLRAAAKLHTALTDEKMYSIFLVVRDKSVIFPSCHQSPPFVTRVHRSIDTYPDR